MVEKKVIIYQHNVAIYMILMFDKYLFYSVYKSEYLNDECGYFGLFLSIIHTM